MDQWTGQIETYLDGELSAAEMQEMDAHLRTCPACTADALQQVQLKRAMQSAGHRYAPSAGVPPANSQSVAAGTRRSPVRLWLRATAALAGALSLALSCSVD